MSTLPPLSSAKMGSLIFVAIATAAVFVIFVKPDLAGKPLYWHQLEEGQTAFAQNRYADAEKAFDAALTTARVCRLDAARKQEAIKNLLVTLKAQKKWQSVAKLQQEYDKARGFVPDKHWNSAYQTAENLFQLNKFAEARSALEKANRHARYFGEENPLLARGHELAARIAMAEGKLDLAQEQAQMSLTMRRHLFPAADPTLVESLKLLAKIQTQRGKYKESDATLKEGLAILERTIGLKNDQANELKLLLSRNATAQE